MIAEKGDPAHPNGGRPKGSPNTKTRLRKLFEMVVDKKNPITGETETFTGAELLDMAIFVKAAKGDVAAYRELLDRVEGKVSQPVDFQAMPPKIELIRVDAPAGLVRRSEEEIKLIENL